MIETEKIVKFVEVGDAGSEYFDAALQIYLAAFPANERHSASVIRNRVAEGSSRLRVGLLNSEVVFMALLWPLQGTEFIVLDYMATNPPYRGKGLATRFMQQMDGELRKANQFFILEVEDERYGQNVAQRKRRKAFYRKLRARELKDVRYVLPPLQGERPTEMNLMIFPGHGVETLGLAKVKSLVLQMYRELYSRDESDPLLGPFVKSLKDPIELD